MTARHAATRALRLMEARRNPPPLAMVMSALAALALMSSYVHVLHRAVVDAPMKQQAAWTAAALHDSEIDRTAAAEPPPNALDQGFLRPAADTARGMARARRVGRDDASASTLKAPSTI